MFFNEDIKENLPLSPTHEMFIPQQDFVSKIQIFLYKLSHLLFQNK